MHDNLETASGTSRESVEVKATGESPKSTKPSWSHLHQELKHALSSWEVLTEQMSSKISPEEEQLLEVKRLLGELKTKLKEFEE